MKGFVLFLLGTTVVIGFFYWIFQTKFAPFAILFLLTFIASAIRDAIHEHDGEVYARGARRTRKKRPVR